MTKRQESNSELLDRLKLMVADTPRLRLHVSPGSAMWIAVGVRNLGLDGHVQVVPDPDCPDPGLGWIEELSAQQWREIRAMVGQTVTVTDARLGALTGTLLTLDHREARVDLGEGDVRYLHWISIESRDEVGR